MDADGKISSTPVLNGVPDVRGKDRLRRASLTAITSLVARFGSIAVLLVTVPLALNHLGEERFGMWMVISSLGAIMAFADFGIGNGILNRVAAASGTDDVEAIRRATSSGFVILVAIGAAVALAIVAAYQFVAWEAVFQVRSEQAVAEAGPAILVFILCFALGVVAGLGSKVQIGLQRGYQANLWVGVGGLLSLISVIAAIKLDAGTPVMVLALFGSQQLAMLLNYIVFLYVQRPDLAPRPRFADAREIRLLLNVGSSFFLLQLVGLIAFRIDALLVAQFFGPETAGTYAIVERLFSLVTVVISVGLAALWPAYAEAISRGDRPWIIRTLKGSLSLAIGGAMAAGTVLTIWNRQLLETWTGVAMTPPLLLIGGFAAFKVIEAAGTAGAMLLNAAGVVRTQVVLALFMGISATALKILFAPGLGLESIIWITFASYLLFGLLPQLVLVPRVVHRLRASSGI